MSSSGSTMERLPAAVTVVGAGGIGCALAHALSSGGVGVTLIEVDHAKIEWGRRHGVAVDELPPHPVELLHFDEWRPSAEDLIFLCTKCYDNAVVLDRIPNVVVPIPVQNGFDARLIARVDVEGIASFVTECMPGRTHTRITRPGALHIGFNRPAGGRELPARTEDAVAVLERFGRFSVRRVPEILPFKHTKLMYNAAISPIAAVAGLDNGALLTIATARRLFFALIRENYRILTNAGLPLGRIGPFHPDTVDRLLRLPLIARLLAVPFSRSLRGTYCSMAGDLPHGPTELDNYNGYLISLAGGRGAPLNLAVYALAKRVEVEGLRPHLHLLDELLDQ